MKELLTANAEIEFRLGRLSEGHKALGWGFFTSVLHGPDANVAIDDLMSHCTSEAVISLDGFKFLNTEGLLWLALLGELAVKRLGKPLKIRLPVDRRKLGFIRRLRLMEATGGTLAIVNGYRLFDITEEKRSEPDLFALNRIDARSLGEIKGGAEQFLTNEFFGILKMQRWGEERFERIRPFRQSISELCENIVEHSGYQVGVGQGYIIARTMPYPVLRLAVGDVGQGIRARLREQGVEVRDDYQAIRTALLYRYLISGETRIGLFKVLQYVARRSGEFRMRTGGAEIALDLKANEWKSCADSDNEFFRALRRVLPENADHRLRGLTLGAKFPGVQVMIDFPIPSRQKGK